MRGAGDLGVQEIVRLLGMARHPEGGWYAETFRAAPGPDGRATGTSATRHAPATRPATTDAPAAPADRARSAAPHDTTEVTVPSIHLRDVRFAHTTAATPLAGPKRTSTMLEQSRWTCSDPTAASGGVAIGTLSLRESSRPSIRRW